jgi:hypothetical protein
VMHRAVSDAAHDTRRVQNGVHKQRFVNVEAPSRRVADIH